MLREWTRRRWVGPLALMAILMAVPACGAGKTKKRRWDDDQFAGLSHRALEKKLQGTWVMPFRTNRAGDERTSPIGRRELWTIQGSTVTRFDGLSTGKRALRVIAPCVVDMRWPIQSRGKQSIVYKTFYFDGDTLHVGDEGGYRYKGTTFACFTGAGPRVVTARGGTCHVWDYPVIHQVRRMQRHKATCAYVTVKGQQYFEVRSKEFYGGKRRLRVSGDLLLRTVNPTRPAKRFPSHAAARKHLTKR